MKYFSRRHCVDADDLPRITTPKRRIAQAAVRCARCGSEREMAKLMRSGRIISVLHCPKCNIAKAVFAREVFPRG